MWGAVQTQCLGLVCLEMETVVCCEDWWAVWVAKVVFGRGEGVLCWHAHWGWLWTVK
jgi:hypothetical protein